METPNYLENIKQLERTSRENAKNRIAYLDQSQSKPMASITAAAGQATERKISSQATSNGYSIDPETLFDIAFARAHQKLNEINEEVYYKRPSIDTQYYLEAFRITEERRQSRNTNHGKIDLGGGHFMTQSSIDEIAASIVRPVLDEISEKATAQRLADKERRAREAAEQLAANELRRIERSHHAVDLQLANEERMATRAIRQEKRASSRAQLEAFKAQEREKMIEERQSRQQKRALEATKAREERRLKLEQQLRNKSALRQVLVMATANILETRMVEEHAQAEIARLEALKATAAARMEAAEGTLKSEHGEQDQVTAAQTELARAKADFNTAEFNVKSIKATQHEQQASLTKLAAKAVKVERHRQSLVGHVPQSPSEASTSTMGSGGSGHTTEFITAQESVSSVDSNPRHTPATKPMSQSPLSQSPSPPPRPPPTTATDTTVTTTSTVTNSSDTAVFNRPASAAAAAGKQGWLKRIFKNKQQEALQT